MFDPIHYYYNTYVLCLLNGLGHEDVLKNMCQRKISYLGSRWWTARSSWSRKKSHLLGDGEIELENLEPEGEKTFTKKVVEVFQEANLNPIYSHNVRYSIWRKACVNGTLNGLCTILDLILLNEARKKRQRAWFEQLYPRIPLLSQQKKESY